MIVAFSFYGVCTAVHVHVRNVFAQLQLSDNCYVNETLSCNESVLGQ